MGSKIPRAGTLEENSFPCIYIGESEKISFGASALNSSVAASRTTIVRLYATKNCFIAIGDGVTADNTAMFLPAGIVEYFGINAGDWVSVIQATAGGDLYLTFGGL